VITVTMRPMNTERVESSSATTKPAANNAANRPFAWRAKCQKNATKPGGGAACSGGWSVGFNSRSKSENMAQARNASRARDDATRGAVRRARLTLIGSDGGGGGKFLLGGLTRGGGAPAPPFLVSPQGRRPSPPAPHPPPSPPARPG